MSTTEGNRPEGAGGLGAERHASAGRNLSAIDGRAAFAVDDRREGSLQPEDEACRCARAKRRFLNVWTIVGACILVGVVIYLLNVLAIPVGIILWTVVICFLLAGTVDFFERHGLPRVFGTTVAYVLMIAVIVVLAVIMFSPSFGIGSQFGDMVSSIPDYVKTATAFFNSLYDRYADVLQNSNVRDVIASLSESFGAWASGLASKSANGVIMAGTSVANIALVVGFALVVAFWMLIELPNLGKEFCRLAGAKHAEAVSMLHATCTRVMGGYIKGTCLQCAIIGVGCGILFAVIGTPNPAAFGVITGVLNIIPVVGPWLGGIVAGLSCIFVSPFTAFVAVVGTVVIQQAVYTFVSPKIIGGAVDIHPALTFIALMAGSGIGGAMSGLSGSLAGALLSIPAVAVMKSVFVYYFERSTGRRIVSPDGVFFKGEAADGEELDPVLDATGVHFAQDAERSFAQRSCSDSVPPEGPERSFAQQSCSDSVPLVAQDAGQESASKAQAEGAPSNEN